MTVSERIPMLALAWMIAGQLGAACAVDKADPLAETPDKLTPKEKPFGGSNSSNRMCDTPRWKHLDELDELQSQRKGQRSAKRSKDL